MFYKVTIQYTTKRNCVQMSGWIKDMLEISRRYEWTTDQRFPFSIWIEERCIKLFHIWNIVGTLEPIRYKNHWEGKKLRMPFRWGIVESDKRFLNENEKEHEWWACWPHLIEELFTMAANFLNVKDLLNFDFGHHRMIDDPRHDKNCVEYKNRFNINICKMISLLTTRKWL